MQRRKIESLLQIAAMAMCLSAVPATLYAQGDHPHSTEGKTMHAIGTFEVKIAPAEVTEPGKAGGIGRMSIDKVWSGDIEGTSKGEMLTGITKDTGSMAYVAMEHVTAKIAGRSGSFYFMHRASMMGSDPMSSVLEVTVVPNSGTGELAGLSGSLAIDMSSGGHRYDFTYLLP